MADLAVHKRVGLEGATVHSQLNGSLGPRWLCRYREKCNEHVV